jgi:cysteine desulfurase
MSEQPIYLDYAATTPVDPRVLEMMLPYFTEHFGNPSSKSHSYGNTASAAVEVSREKLAKAINARPQEIIFTSGATEAINLAIKGVALANESKTKHFIAVATEHKAVLDCFDWLEHNGYETTILPVDSDGILDPQQVADAIRSDTVMVSVMMVNNETGVIQDIAEIGEICKKQGVYFMTDATQSLVKEKIDIRKMNIDLLAASSHKIYGPKGVGMLYASRSNPRVKIEPILHGGGHEKGLRSGTLATPLIVGFGEAVKLSCAEMKREHTRILNLRDALQNELLERVPGSSVNGDILKRVAGILNIKLPPVDAEALVASLANQVAFSTGSACTSEKVEPSHVLSSMALDSTCSIRLTLGRPTQDVSNIAELFVSAVVRLSALLV